MRRLLALALVACAAHIPPPPVAFPQFAPFRLPHTFEPARYRARLAFLPWRFNGHIEIDGTLATPTDLIWLHGVDLDVHTATAVRGATRIPLAASPPREDETIALVARTPLPAGPWTLELDYSGPIRDHDPTATPYGTYHALGLFRRGDFLFTMSEPIYARRIFPCIDEPDRKVPWQLTLDVPAGDTAASNAPVVHESPLDADRKRVEFAPTLPLPSYLVAFAVGPFEVVDLGRARVLVRPGHLPLPPALGTTSDLLARLEEYTGVPYPYPKLDLVVVPQLGVGGMEHPGLISLDDDMVASPYAANGLAHELAHQWFGNLVTLRWWDDIWLNESFATWMDKKLVPAPYAGSLTVDDPVRMPAGDREQLSIDHFLTEQRMLKGAALLAAIEAAVGEDAFRRVVRRYLMQHAHGLATTADFAAALGIATDHAVDDAFAGLMQHRVPVLEAHLECRALVLARPLPWPTPICVAYDRDGRRDETCVPARAGTTEVALPAQACPTWVMPEPRAAALYQTVWAPLLAGLLDRGWSQLSSREQSAIYSELHSDEERLRVMGRLADAALDPRFVRAMSGYVPDDLRGAFDRWVQVHLASRAAAVHLADAGQPDWTAAELLARAGDKRLLAEAIELAGRFTSDHRDMLGYTAAGIAVDGDPAFASQILASALAESNPRRRGETLNVLFNTDVPALFAREPAKAAQLTTDERTYLLSLTCTRTARAELAKLTSVGRLFVYIDQCLAEKQRLEPAFRA